MPDTILDAGYTEPGRNPDAGPALAPLPRYDDARALVAGREPREPVYCLYPRALETVARRFLEGFPGRVLYAVKANPDKHVLSRLLAAGVRNFDTASLPEIALVKELAPDAHCHFMAPARLIGAAGEAYARFGMRDYVVDHPEALSNLLAETGGRDLTIFVRLATPSASSMYDFTSKFGAPPAQAVALLRAVVAAGAEPALAFNVGSMVMDPAAYRAGLAVCREVLEESGVRPRLVDLGGGFPSPYPGVASPPLEDFFGAIAEAGRALPLAPDAELLGEPGRALVAEGLSLVTQVILRKEESVYLNDGIYGSISEPGLSAGEVHFPTRPIRLDGDFSSETRTFKVFGPTCDSLDVLPRPFELPADIRTGDWVEFGMLGAYSNAMRTRFNGFYPDTMVEIGDADAWPPGVEG